MTAMDDIIESICLRFPGISVRIDGDAMCISGMINKEDHFHNVHLCCINFPHVTCHKLFLLQKHEINTIKASERIETDTFAADLFNLIFGKNAKAKTSIHSLGNDFHLCGLQQNHFSEVVELYDATSHKIQTNATCTQIRFSELHNYADHYIEVDKLNDAVLRHSLPEIIEKQFFFQKCPNLQSVLRRFQKALKELSIFYENINTIDELCCVVQPTNPSTKDNWRCIRLQDRLFLKIQIADPFDPVTSLSFKLIGPAYAVEPIRSTISEGLHRLDTNLDVHANLLRLFDLCYFPAQFQENICNICFCEKFEDSGIPMVSCDNDHCCLIFHIHCLRSWFKTLLDEKTFLEVTLGCCPFCKTKLSTTYTELF